MLGSLPDTSPPSQNKNLSLVRQMRKPLYSGATMLVRLLLIMSIFEIVSLCKPCDDELVVCPQAKAATITNWLVASNCETTS